MFKIIKKEENLSVQNIKVLLYGQPGIGKTSLANTANRTITLDFDNGSHRAIVRNDVVQVNSWQDAIDFVNSKELLADYDTIVIDTVGKMSDLLSLTMPVMLGKVNLKQASGEPTLKGYGYIKQQAINLLKMLDALKKDIIYIAHDREDKNGDNVIIRPDISSSLLQVLTREVDLIGFLSVQNKQRVLNFEPSDEYIGKNCANFNPITIQDKFKNNFDMSSIIQETKTALENMTQEQREAIETIKLFTELVSNCQSVQDLNDVLEKNKSIDKKIIKLQIWQLLQIKATELNCEFNNENLAFVKIKTKSESKTDTPDLEQKTKEPILEPVNQETIEFVKPF